MSKTSVSGMIYSNDQDRTKLNWQEGVFLYKHGLGDRFSRYMIPPPQGKSTAFYIPSRMYHSSIQVSDIIDGSRTPCTAGSTEEKMVEFKVLEKLSCHSYRPAPPVPGSGFDRITMMVEQESRRNPHLTNERKAAFNTCYDYK